MEGFRRVCRLRRTGKLVLLGSSDESQPKPNDEGCQPILPLAMGWLCKEVPHQEWITFTAAASLAKVIAEHWFTKTKQTESARLNAKMAGELFAIYHADKFSQEGMSAARQAIVDILKEYFINNREIVKNAVKTITERVSGPHISRGKVGNVSIPSVNKGVLVNAQQHAMFASFGPAIPCTIMKNPVWKDFWRKCVSSIPSVSKPTQDLELADDYAETISAMSEEDIIGLFEAVVHTRPDQLRQYTLASVFICIAALCQGESASDRWVEERLKHLQKQGLNINIKEYITAEIIDVYDELYPRQNLTNSAMLCQTIVVMHACLEERDHQLLECMIQQAIIANISPVPSLAYVAAARPTLKWGIALKNKILMQELKALTYVCMHFIRNPIGFVIPTTIPRRLYSDWCYMGMQLQKKLQGAERLYCNYKITLTVMKENKNTLDALCTKIVEGKESVDLTECFAGMNVGNIQSDETWFYVTPAFQSRVLDLPGAEGQLVKPSTCNWEGQTLYDTTKPGKCIAKEDIRATWPANFRNLPKYAYRVPISNIKQHIQNMPVALKEVLCAVHNTDRSTMLINSYIKDGISHMEFQFQRALRDSIRKALVTLGVPQEHIPFEAPNVIHQAYRRRQVFVSPANILQSLRQLKI